MKNQVQFILQKTGHLNKVALRQGGDPALRAGKKTVCHPELVEGRTQNQTHFLPKCPTLQLIINYLTKKTPSIKNQKNRTF